MKLWLNINAYIWLFIQIIGFGANIAVIQWLL